VIDDPGPTVTIASHWLVTITLNRKLDDLISGIVPVNVTSTVCFLVAALHEKLRGEVKDISCEVIL
jgi:hypothetical protein